MNTRSFSNFFAFPVIAFFILSCGVNEPQTISSGISREDLCGKWVCTFNRYREWIHDSIAVDTTTIKSDGIFSIQFTDSLFIGINPIKDTINLDSVPYLFINPNRLFMYWDFHYYFFGYVDVYYSDSTLIIRDADSWTRSSDSTKLFFWSENIYRFSKVSN